MAAVADGRPAAFDLLRVPGLARYLAWRHARRALQMPMLVVAALLLAVVLLAGCSGLRRGSGSNIHEMAPSRKMPYHID